MTLHRALIDRRTKFREHGQLCIGLSSVTSPGDPYSLLPDDMDGFTGRPSVEVDGVQILKTMQSSTPLPICPISPGDNMEPGIASIEPSDATLSDELPCPDDYLHAPEDQVRCVLSLDYYAVEIFDPYSDKIHRVKKGPGPLAISPPAAFHADSYLPYRKR
jgi:hypothetical protein